MVDRIGNVLFALGCIFGALFATILVWSSNQQLDNPGPALTLWAVFALGSVVIGWTCRYILKGL